MSNLLYSPNGGTLHDLAAVLTRWAVVDGPDLVALWDMYSIVFDSAVKETGKSVSKGDLAHDSLMLGSFTFSRFSIQRNYNLVRKAFA